MLRALKWSDCLELLERQLGEVVQRISAGGHRCAPSLLTRVSSPSRNDGPATLSKRRCCVNHSRKRLASAPCRVTKPPTRSVS